MLSCKTATTKYRRAVAPSVRESKKMPDPVRYDRGPRRCAK